MNKKLFPVLMIIFLLSGCSKLNTYNIYESLYNCYNSMHAFKAEVAVTAFSNNSENKYTLTQYYKAPDKHRSEYTSESGEKGVTVINGQNGKLFSDFTSEPYVLNGIDIAEKDFLLLSTFFEIYYASEETSVKTSGRTDNGEITLSAQTGSTNPYRHSIELVVDTKTLNPKKMTVLDCKGKPRILVEYINFELNPSFEDGIFE